MLLAPAAHRGPVRRHARDRLAAEQRVEHAGAEPGDDHRDHQPPRARGRRASPYAEQLPDRDHDEEAARSAAAPRAGGGCRTSSDVTTLVPAQATTGRLAAHRPRPKPSWTRVGMNDAMPIIPAPRTSEPAVAARNRGSRSSSGSTSGCADAALDDDERRQQRRPPGRRGRRSGVDPVAPLGQRGDGERHRGDQQDQPGDVDARAARPPPTRRSAAGSGQTRSRPRTPATA